VASVMKAADAPVDLTGTGSSDRTPEAGPIEPPVRGAESGASLLNRLLRPTEAVLVGRSCGRLALMTVGALGCSAAVPPPHASG